MNSKFFTIALAALVLGVFSAPATSLTSSTPVAGTNGSPTDAMTALFGDPVVAKGKGFEIKQSALDQVLVPAKARALAQAQANHRQLPPDYEARIEVDALNHLTTIQLLLQTANAADQASGQKDADLLYSNILKQFPSPEAFTRQLKAVGTTLDGFRAETKDESVANEALKRVLNVAVTDAEVSGFYTGHPSDFEQPERVHVRHLLLMTIDPATQAPLPADQIALKRKSVDDLLKRARAGEDFAALARQYSEDPGSKDKGGEYTFPRGQMVQEFETAAFALTNNQVSDVVTTKYGFHIIKLLEHIPAKTVDLATVSEDIKTYLVNQKISKLLPDYLQKLKKTSELQILDAKLKAETEADEAAAAAAAADAPAMEAPAAGAPATGGQK